MRLVAGACALMVLLAGRAVAQEDLVIGIGEQKILSVPSGSDIGFTGPLHVSRLDSKRIKVIGDATGWGNVTVKSGDEVYQYSVQVVAVPPEQTVGKLKSLLGSMDLTYTPAGSQVIVEGRIETTADLERFNKVMEAFPDVINLVVIAAREPLIDIAVTLVEVEATNSSGFGLLNIQPPTGQGTLTGAMPLADITGRSVDPGAIQVSFALSSQLLEALDAQLICGRAKIIANPRVVTQNMREAAITSGGEIPYRVISATGTQGIEYKPYGITLKVTPEARSSDVLLQLHLESSEPVGSVSSGSENPLTSRSIDLGVAVEKDKTLAIAGLYNAVMSRDTRGGCLFPLFAASSSTRKRELIVLVTPRVSVEGIGSDFLRVATPNDLER